MKGDRGVCTAGTGVELLRRTKFNTKQNAQDACDFHVGMGFAPSDSIVYKCKVCKMYHFAKPEFAKKYSSKK